MQTKAALNREEKDTYMVTVTATDPSGLFATVNVTINITNMPEPPVIRVGGLAISGMARVDDYAENGTDAVATYMASGPDASMATWSLEGDDAGQFSITNGMLMFMTAPDYEMPADADMDNTYMVTVNATDGTYTDTHDVTVMVTDVDEMGTVTLPAMEPSVGTEIMATVTDPDMADMTSVTWQWASSNAMDVGYTDIEGATSASYTPVETDVTMYLRATAMYTDVHGSDQSASAVSANMVRGLAISGMDSVEYAENGTDAVETYMASGPDASMATWSLEGDDAGQFSITNGMLMFMTAPDYEMPADADMDNTYMVTVNATDGTYTDTHDVTVMVTDVDEMGTVTLPAMEPSVGTEIMATVTDPDMADMTSVTWQWASSNAMDVGYTDIEGATSASYTPVETDVTMYLRATAMYTDVHGSDQSASAVSASMVRGLAISGMDSVEYAENGTDAVATYMASGPDASMATWSLEGDDAGQFSITNGMLMFMTAPDYEMPADADMDNTYMVTVNATDGTYTDTHDVTVMVTDVDEMGTVTLSAMEPSVGTEIMATVTDPDMADMTSVTWQWASSNAMDVGYTDIEGATSASYTPVETDVTMYLRATAMYTDGHGSDQSASAVSASMVRGLAISGMDSVEYAENGTDAVATYMASGPDASMATWSLEGDDAGQFSITNGMLMFMTAPDYEMPADADMDNTYMVTVNATDGTYTDTHDVTVMVTDVDEMGTVTLSAMEPSVGTEIMATVTDPDMADMTSVTWQWASSNAMDVGYTDIEGATSASYTPVETDVTMYLRPRRCTPTDMVPTRAHRQYRRAWSEAWRYRAWIAWSTPRTARTPWQPTWPPGRMRPWLPGRLRATTPGSSASPTECSCS